MDDGNIFAYLVGLFILFKLISFITTLLPMILIGIAILALISFFITHSLEEYDENKHRKDVINQNYDSILANSYEVLLQVENKTYGMMNIWLQLGSPSMSSPVMFEKTDGYNEKMSYKYEILGSLSAISGTMFSNEQFNPSGVRVLKLKYRDNSNIYFCDVFNSPYRTAVINMNGIDYLEVIK